MPARASIRLPVESPGSRVSARREEHRQLPWFNSLATVHEASSVNIQSVRGRCNLFLSICAIFTNCFVKLGRRLVAFTYQAKEIDSESFLVTSFPNFR